jgi:hypothetical protein
MRAAVAESDPEGNLLDDPGAENECGRQSGALSQPRKPRAHGADRHLRKSIES